MKLGIDHLLSDASDLIKGKRIGILSSRLHHTASEKPTIEALCSSKAWKVTALFGPEHGIEMQAQYMEPVVSHTDAVSRLPVFSLYGDTVESLSPTPEMLNLIDTLVIDCQDVGSRYYTYIWTTIFCMRACAKEKKSIVICDRPNPIGGVAIEGREIKPGFESFVGMYSIPNRHGMTIGEMASYFNGRKKIGCDLHVVPVSEWSREMHWPATGLPWHNPSPNMRSYTAALLYPGMCLLEGTNCSEGRGTERPFEIVGAPYAQTEELIGSLEELRLPGVSMDEARFIPTFDKWKRQTCFGLQWRIEDTKQVRPYLNGLAFIWVLYRLYSRKGFEWRIEPYEFVRRIPAIDLLTGSDAFRKRITTRDFAEIVPLAEPSASFSSDREGYLFYTA